MFKNSKKKLKQRSETRKMLQNVTISCWKEKLVISVYIKSKYSYVHNLKYIEKIKEAAHRMRIKVLSGKSRKGFQLFV